MVRALSTIALASVVTLAGLAPSALAQAEAPSGEDWQLRPEVSPDDGFTVTATGTVDGEPARLERSFGLDTGELTIRYTLGEGEPERSVEAHLRIVGVYVFEDDGDGRLDVSDRIVGHQRVDPGEDAYVTPVRATQPLDSVRAVLGLEDNGQVVLTMTTTSRVAMQRGADLSPTETRLNLTVADVATTEGRHAAIALDARAPDASQPSGTLVRLGGDGASVDLASMGPIPSDVRAGASAFQEEDDEGERALVFLAGASGPATSHEAEANVVHTSAGLAEVGEAVQGQPGAFVLGLLAASMLVGATAWRKLQG